MKSLNLFTKIVLVFAVIGFFASCEPEVSTDNPTVSLVDEVGFVSSATTIDAGTTFSVKLSADRGSADMTTLTVRKDGDLLSTSLFTIDGSLDNNPKLLFDGDRSGFTYEIAITTENAGESSYSFVVADEEFGSSTVSVTITAEDNVQVDPILVNNMNSSVQIANPGSVKIVLNGTAGSSPLDKITVLQEGTLVATNRLRWNDVQFGDNPLILEGTDRDGFTNAELLLQSGTIIGTSNYTITLTDEAGVESTINYSIELLPIGTDITTEFTGVILYNNAGANFGAIDLETGTNVTSTSNPDADLIDVGNDANGNWRMQIRKSTNGTSLRSVDASYTYSTVTTVEVLQAAYDGGVELDETGTLIVGSTYAAQSNGVLYLFTIVEVNDTSTGNLDNYVLNIKKAG